MANKYIQSVCSYALIVEIAPIPICSAPIKNNFIVQLIKNKQTLSHVQKHIKLDSADLTNKYKSLPIQNTDRDIIWFLQTWSNADWIHLPYDCIKHLLLFLQLGPIQTGDSNSRWEDVEKVTILHVVQPHVPVFTTNGQH